MKAIQMTGYGTPSEVCQCVEVDDVGEPGPGEVVIAIEAAAINPADLLIIEGKYASKPPLPAALGIEGAGRIAAVGEGVDIDLDGVFQERIQQHRAGAGNLHGVGHVTPEAVQVMDDFHGPAAEHIGGPDHQRIADVAGDGLGLFVRPGEAVFRLFQA